MARRRKVIDDSDIDSSSSSEDPDDVEDFRPGYDPDRDAEEELFRDPYQRGKRRRKRRRGEDAYDPKEEAIYGAFAHASDEELRKGKRRGGPSRLHRPQTFVSATKENPLEDPQPLADVDAAAENAGAASGSGSDMSASDSDAPSDEEVGPVEDAQPPPEALSGRPGLGAAATATTGLGAGPRVGLGAAPASSANYAAAKMFAKAGAPNETPTTALGAKAGLGTNSGLGAGGAKIGLGAGLGLGHKSVKQLVEEETPGSSDAEAAQPERRSFLGATPPPAAAPTKPKPFLSREEQKHFAGLSSSSSIGMKLLSKMGWSSGVGLGAKGEGIVTPIESKLRPKGAGLAFGGFGERTKQARDEDRRKGKALSSDEDEDEWGRKKGRKGKVRASLDSTRAGTPTSDSAQRPPAWKRAKPKRQPVVRKTYEEILAEQGSVGGVDAGIGQIVDLTGQALPSLPSTLTANITAPTDEDRKTLPELRHNLRLLCDMGRAEVQGLAKEGKALTERRRWAREERMRVEGAQTKQIEKRQRLERVGKAVAAVGDVSRSVASEDKEEDALLGELEDVCEGVILAAGGEAEYDGLRLDEVVVAAATPVLRRAWAHWQPLEDPRFLVARLQRWRRLFRLQKDVLPAQPREVDIFGSVRPSTNGHVNGGDTRTMTAFETLLWTQWLPRVRSAVNVWSPADAQPLVDLFVAWRPLLPHFIVDNILDQLVLPKLSTAIAEWSPRRTDCPSLHAIVIPWLEHASVGGRMDDVLDQAKRRIRGWLNSWRAKDGVPKGLAVWRDVFAKKEWDELVLKTVVPGLGVHLRDHFRVDPRQQDMSPLEAVLPWRALLRSSIFGQLLQIGVFSKWLDALWMWLTSTAPDYDQINQWLAWWKSSALPPDVAGSKIVEDGFARGFETVNRARSIAALGLSVKDKLERPDLEKRPLGSRSATPTPSSTPGVKGVRPSAQPRQVEEVTFRSIVEEEAAKENLILVPTGRSLESTGAPLLRVAKTVDGKGGVTIYIEDDVVYARVGEEWEPMLVEDMLARAKG